MSRNYYRKLLQEFITGNYYRKLLQEIITGNNQLVYQSCRKVEIYRDTGVSKNGSYPNIDYYLLCSKTKLPEL